MHAMIAAEVKRRELADNIKLGPGGIREIEFIAQSFQLVRGGFAHPLSWGAMNATVRRIALRSQCPSTRTYSSIS